MNEFKKQGNILRGVVLLGFMMYICLAFITTIMEDKEQLITCLYIVIPVVSIILLCRWIRYLIVKRQNINYIREIPKKYSLPVVAYLYKKSLHIDAVIIAMILKLKQLNLIQEKIENNKIIYTPVENSPLDITSGSERYLYYWITALDKSNYSFKQFSEVLEKELVECGLMNTQLPAHIFEYIAIFIASFIFVICHHLGFIGESLYDMFLMLLFVGAILATIIKSFSPKKLCEYTKKGFKEHYVVLGFYRFLKDFTRLSKRDMEEQIIWEEYLIFAVIFNLNIRYEIKNEYQFLTQNEIMDILEKMGESKD